MQYAWRRALNNNMRWLALLPLVLLAVAASSEDADDTVEQYSEGGADTCLGCHNADDMLVIFRTPHGQQADPESPMAQLQCENCHGPGGEHAGRRSPKDMHNPVIMFGNDSATPVTDQNAVCMNCHSKDVTLGWEGSMHERNDTGCASCHTVHSATDPVGLHASQADVCFDCHKRQRADSMKPSSHPVRSDHQARVSAMTCTSCHNPHSSNAASLLARNTTNELCVECHAEYRGPMLFDHPPVSEDCTLCHQPHGSQHANLLKRRPPLLCQSCHSQRGHPSLSYTDASLPGSNPSAMVLERGCLNCHTQVHGSNHPSGYKLVR